MSRTSWVAGLALAATAAGAAEPAIEPGLYEIVTKSSLGPAVTARQCLTAVDIAKGLQPDMGKECKVTRSTIGGGKLDFAATCPDMTSSSTGTYTATSYQIDGKVRIKDASDPMTMESHIAGKKVGVCKG